jgi:putative flippase GtrA
MKIIRYFGVGGVAGLLDLSIFTIMVKGFHFDWFYVALLSFIIATGVNYYLSIKYVFQSGVRFSLRNEIFLVFFVSAIGLAVNQFVLLLLIEVAVIDAVVSKMVATSAVFIWNFVARNSFVFRSPR